jgi:hypothetical protein
MTNRRCIDTALPNNPDDASEPVRMHYIRMIIDLHHYAHDPAEQAAYARRFDDVPALIDSPPPSRGPFDFQKTVGVHRCRDVIVISSDSSSEEDPDEMDGYEQDVMGLQEKEEIDEDEAFRVLTENLRNRLAAASSSDEEDYDLEEEEEEHVEEAPDTEDTGMDADRESEGEDDSETYSILAHEDQEQLDEGKNLLSSDSENIEEEFRGRNRRRKRLNGHSDRSSSGSNIVHRPLRKRARPDGDADSDEEMEDEPQSQMTASEEEYWSQTLAQDRTLPPYARTSGENPDN